MKRRIQRSALLLVITGMPSCGDTFTPPQAAPLITAPVTLIDATQLKNLGRIPRLEGERIALTAPDDSANALRSTQLMLRDSAVLSLDALGVLYARSAGQSWITWPGPDGTDSTMITVAPSSPAPLQQEFTEPVGPLRTVDVRYPTGRSRGIPTEKSWRVAAGGDLQAALDAAKPGDEIVLATGAVFTGNFVLPNKAGSDDWIIVRAEVPPVAAGTRTSPAAARASAQVITPNQDPAIRTAPGAHRWRLVGFQIAHGVGAIYNYGIVVLGRGTERNIEELPSDIVLDRMYVHGSTTEGTSRCVAFNGRSLAVIDSWLGECHAKGYDAQGICGWNGPGPFLIENNQIEASGQAIMFGGADPVIANVSPSDITIRRNYLYKPLTWGHSKWTIKATFELKHGRRVLFEGNVLENHWADAQTGFAILFQTLSDNNTAWAWTTVQDVMVRNNFIKNSAQGANVAARAAYGGPSPTNPTSRVAFVNNLWQDVGKDPFTSVPGVIFQILGDLQDVTFVNNSVTLDGQAAEAVLFDGAPGVRTRIVNNIFPTSQYGILGSSRGVGTPALAYYAPSGNIFGNVLPGQDASEYPANNFFPSAGPAGQQSQALLTGKCPMVQSWIKQQGLPAATGTDCDLLEVWLRNVAVTTP